MTFRFPVTLLLLVFSISAFSQKVKKRKELLELGQGMAYYSVLKSDKSLKHGNYYEKLHSYNGNKIVVYGNYSHGKKEGLWTERYTNRINSIKNQGYYKKGERVGIWNFYDFTESIKENETFVQKYNYDNEELIMSTECANDKEYEVFIDGKLLISKLDCPPSLIGGVSFLESDLSQRFSLSFISNDISRKKRLEVLKIENVASVLVKKDGTIGEIKFRGDTFNPELMRFLEKEIPKYGNQWIPGKLNDKKVDTFLDITIRLKIKF